MPFFIKHFTYVSSLYSYILGLKWEKSFNTSFTKVFCEKHTLINMFCFKIKSIGNEVHNYTKYCNMQYPEVVVDLPK